MTVVLFLLILTALVFVHELGHFLAAKAFGIRVDEFAVGFPPRIAGFTRGETRYSINLIPFGGYVKIFGENPDEASLAGPDAARSFANAAKWKQIVILLAGISMNFLAAWLLIAAAFNIGLVTSTADRYGADATNVSVMVLSVDAGSPAATAGIRTGDRIIGISSAAGSVASPTATDIQNVVAESAGDVTVTYERGGRDTTAVLAPASGIVSGKRAIGVALDEAGTVRFGFFRSLVEAAKLTAAEAKGIAVGLWQFVAGALGGQHGALANIAGPVGIAGMVATAEQFGFSYLLGFIALISINLAVLNLVPFPALDGGRAFFVLVEAVIRRRIKPAVLNWTNMIGFALLIGLMLFITYHDILRLVG